MKKTFQIPKRRLLCCLLAMMLLLSTILLSGCKNEPVVIKDSDTCIVIRPTQEVVDNNPDMVLIDYMEKLIQAGDMTCTISNGMVISLNGIENPADYSSCWMLYTSDVENSNSAWGTVEYDGQKYGSAISGAEVLKIKPGQLYIWVFQSFG